MADLVKSSRWVRTAAGMVAVCSCSLAFTAAASDDNLPISDPTRPPPGYGPVHAGGAADATAAPAQEPMRLQMIARSGSARLAVLNGRSVHPGDELTVAGKTVTIVAIQDGSVVLQQEGRRQTLELIPHAGSGAACAGGAPRSGACPRDPPGARR
jgi:hypothetical protein